MSQPMIVKKTVLILDSVKGRLETNQFKEGKLMGILLACNIV